MNKCLLTVFFTLIYFALASGQFAFHESKSLNKKMDKMAIELFFPIETQIKKKKRIKDDFAHYDLVLKSSRRFEVRYVFVPVDMQSDTRLHPHVETTRLIASIATNDQDEHIAMEPLDQLTLNARYAADWGVSADFVPKEAFSHFPYGKILSLYKENSGLVNCIILYKNENLDGFLGLPMRFKEEVRVSY
jgi:hypothetical protein